MTMPSCSRSPATSESPARSPRIVLTLLVLAFSGSCIAPGELEDVSRQDRGDFYTTVHLTEREALELALPGAKVVRGNLITPTPEERAALQTHLRRPLRQDRFRVFFGLDEQGELEGYAVIQEEIGKFKFFTFIVSVLPDGEVRRVAVLVYREARGGEVAHRRFLQQYEGKTRSAPLSINRDILNITGATMSVNSMNRGVRKVLGLIEVLFRNDPDRLEQAIRQAPEVEFDEKGALVTRSTPEDVRVTGTRLLMGSLCRIELRGSSREKLERARDAAFETMERTEALLSDYRPTSELSRLGQRSGEWVEISPVTARFLEICKEQAELTGGLLDPTVAPLLEAWGVRQGSPRVPSPHELEELRDLIGAAKIELTESPLRARLARPGMRLDPGAIGKGFAMDLAAETLEEAGVGHFLINFSGCILARGSSGEGPGWPVAVRDPRERERILGQVRLVDRSISTSTAWPLDSTSDSRGASFLISPKTLEPVTAPAGAVVIAPTATEADAGSTTAAIEGTPALLRLESLPGHEALVSLETGESRSTSTWPLAESQPPRA